jgi:hypothetical protein
LACLTNKAKPGEAAGAENPLIAECQGIPSRTVVEATARLRDLGIVESSQGFSHNPNRTIYVPTSLGRKVSAITTQADTCTNQLPGTGQEAIHLEEAVAKCLGCIWTKQIANEEKPAASTSMIAHCSGLPQKSVQNAIRKMVEAGELSRALIPDIMHDSNHPVPAYAPSTYLRALPATGGKKCKLPHYADIPTHYLQPLTAKAFVLPPRQKVSDIYREPWFTKKSQPRHPQPGRGARARQGYSGWI